MEKVDKVKQLRSFGLLVGGIFAIIGLVPFLLHGEPPRLWALLLAAVLMIPAILLPRSLTPVYRAWMAIGHALGWVNTRIILSVVFYGLFTPVGLFRRLFGKDSFNRRLSNGDTYRVESSLRPSSHMKRQF